MVLDCPFTLKNWVTQNLWTDSFWIIGTRQDSLWSLTQGKQTKQALLQTAFWFDIFSRLLQSNYGGLSDLGRHIVEEKLKWVGFTGKIIRASEICLEFLLSLYLNSKVYMFGVNYTGPGNNNYCEKKTTTRE